MASSLAELGIDVSHDPGLAGQWRDPDNFMNHSSANIDVIYQSLLGRNADPGGKDYWKDWIDSGGSYGTLVDTIKHHDPHYQEIQEYKEINPNWTTDQWSTLPSAYLSPFHGFSGSAVADWLPSMGITY